MNGNQVHEAVPIRLGVYSSCRPGSPSVLVPDCMLPPLAVEREHGPLVFRGFVDDCADATYWMDIVTALETRQFVIVPCQQVDRLIGKQRLQLVANA